MTATLPPAASPAAEVIPARAWRVLAVTSLGVFLVLLDTTSINLAFPATTAAFPSSTRAALWWVLNAYAIGAASRRGGRSCCLSMRTSRGRFDPGRCRDCARESDLLDHYWQVQRQKRALIQVQRSAWHAHATPSGRCRVPSSRCCWPPSPCSRADPPWTPMRDGAGSALRDPLVGLVRRPPGQLR